MLISDQILINNRNKTHLKIAFRIQMVIFMENAQLRKSVFNLSMFFINRWLK